MTNHERIPREKCLTQECIKFQSVDNIMTQVMVFIVYCSGDVDPYHIVTDPDPGGRNDADSYESWFRFALKKISIFFLNLTFKLMCFMRTKEWNIKVNPSKFSASSGIYCSMHCTVIKGQIFRYTNQNNSAEYYTGLGTLCTLS